MFLKHRKLWTAVFGVTAASFLTLGLACGEYRERLEEKVARCAEVVNNYEEEITLWDMTTSDTTTVAVPDREVSSTGKSPEESSSEEETSEESSSEAESSEERTSLTEPETLLQPEEYLRAREELQRLQAEAKEREKWLGIAGALGYALGIFGALLFLIFLRQKQPCLGPEAALIGGAGVLALWPYGERIDSFWLEMAAGWLLALLLLMFLRELCGWLLHRCCFSWSSFHRLGKYFLDRTGRQSAYFAVQSAVCVLGTTAGSCAALGGRPFWLYVSGFFCAVLSAVGMKRLFAQMDHLTGQIRALHEGHPVTPGSGLFEENEKELADLVRQRDEAVKEAVTSERFKVELISNVSHDLRTPLTSILGYGELLERETGLSPEGKRQLAALNLKTGYMRDLVDSLFELTKVSSGILEPNRQEIDLLRLLEQTLGLYDDKLKEAGLTVRRHYPSQRLPIVTDGARMHRVFANLVGNAVKYGLPGSRIHLEVTAQEGICRVRMINVASYEMDFAPEEMLERFARGDKARSTPGSGIGLAIAQTYTESVGGHFHVEIDGEQFIAVVELPG